MGNLDLAETDAGHGYVNVTGTEYSITINMSADTVEQLGEEGFRLFTFKAVQTSMKGGAPTVWATSNSYSTQTTIGWTEQYYGYASTKEITNGVNFLGSSTTAVDLGQTVNVSAHAVVTPVEGGTPGSVSIFNTTSTPFSCGLSQPSSAGSKPAPVCAFPLHGHSLDVITPLQKVALVFATAPQREGTVIESSLGPAVLVDLTGLTSATLNYDIDLGWSWNGTNISNIPQQQFVQSLIVPPPGVQLSAGTPVNSVAIWRPSPSSPIIPQVQIASAAAGTTDAASLDAVLQTVGYHALPVAGGHYIATYTVPGVGEQMWQVQCTTVPGNPANAPFKFAKLREIVD